MFRDLLTKLHPNVISRSFRMAADKCVEVSQSLISEQAAEESLQVLDGMSAPIAEDDHEMLVRSTIITTAHAGVLTTCLSTGEDLLHSTEQ